MVRKKVVVLLVFLSTCLYTVSGTGTTSAPCPPEPRCTCQFQEGSVDSDEGGGGADVRAVGMAGAVGALSSLLLSGGGFALWRLLRSRGRGGVAYDRPPSASSQGSWAERSGGRRPSNPPATPKVKPFGRDEPVFDRTHGGSLGPGTPTNIYRMGRVWTGRTKPL